MKIPLKVLVTAVAGDLGQALVKALRISQLPIEIHGVDLKLESYSVAFVESYHAVPPAQDPVYIEAINGLCRELDIKAVIPASEPEILTLRGGALPNGIPTISQSGIWLGRFVDKLRAMEFLSGKVDLAPFADGTDEDAVNNLVSRCGFPVVVKPRSSSGSRSFHVVKNEKEMRAALAATAQPLVQNYLDDSGGEFSVGVFRCPSFETAIAFKRKLGANVGLSWEAEVVQCPEVIDYALDVARVANAQGSLNIQVRLTKSGPKLLEINSRFSSLVAARAFAGFKDAEWSILMALGLELPTPPPTYQHIRFRRFFHEMIDVGTGFGAVSEWSPKMLSYEELNKHD